MRITAGGDLVEWPANMAPAESQLHVARFGERAIAGIAIDLQNPVEAIKMSAQSGLSVISATHSRADIHWACSPTTA